MTALASLSGTRTFTLDVHVTDLQTQKLVEVSQDSHVGQIMLEIVEKLGKYGLPICIRSGQTRLVGPPTFVERGH